MDRRNNSGSDAPWAYRTGASLGEENTTFVGGSQRGILVVGPRVGGGSSGVRPK